MPGDFRWEGILATLFRMSLKPPVGRTDKNARDAVLAWTGTAELCYLAIEKAEVIRVFCDIEWMLVCLKRPRKCEYLDASLAKGTPISLLNGGLPKQHGKNRLSVFQESRWIQGLVD